MNILVFTSFFPNNVFPNHCVFTKERMAPFQRMNGCRMKVVAPVPYFPPVKITHRWKFSQVVMREKIEGFDVYHPRYYLTPKVGMTTYGLMMFLSALPTVKRIRKEFDFDLIDTHCVYPDGFAGVLMGRYFGKPVVVTSHGTDLNLYPKIRMMRTLLRYTLQKADRVIAVSQALKNVAVGLGIGEEKISVIPNGIDTGKFFPMPEGQARGFLNLPDKKVILSVGALIPTKGFDLLIRAVKILIEKHGRKDLFLVIVGEGPARGDLEKLIASLDLAENVHLTGGIPHKNIHLWYNAADLFCLTSHREGWACVLIEALACGTPVVATNVGGAPELVRSEKYGLLANVNIEDIAEKISFALDTNWNRDEIVEYARGFTWEIAAKELNDLYGKVSRNSSGQG